MLRFLAGSLLQMATESMAFECVVLGIRDAQDWPCQRAGRTHGETLHCAVGASVTTTNNYYCYYYYYHHYYYHYY